MAYKSIGPGDAQTLGATVHRDGTNFALYSADAERVELCLFQGETEAQRYDLPRCDDGVWHGLVPDCGAGTAYGYRVHGAYDPGRGLRFNPHKLLLDPYARCLRGGIDWAEACYAFDRSDAQEDLSFNTIDSAPFVPKAVVTAPPSERASDWPSSARPPIARPRRAFEETVLYEAHLRGLTVRHPALSDGQRGTFAGLGAEPTIEHLKQLGITAIELLPIQAFVHDHFLVERDLRNYWGYSPLGYFAPQPEYLGGSGVLAVRDAVRALHDAGIEVILDVVYNHTAEGNHLGPHLSFRGIDNRTYYRLDPDEPRFHVDWTGCGNTLNLAHPRVEDLVVASLRYWTEVMEVDGFRFDLATTVGRAEHDFDVRCPLFQRLGQDPVLRHSKLIAEPWDLGPEGYRLGGFPLGWAEWNDRFRDVTRSFWRGDAEQLPEFARRVHGSSDLFDRAGRATWAGVNFVASHDGFTLWDLVSFEERHNEANLEDNRDGHHANFSSNAGVEGASEDPDVIAARQRRRRNLLATVFLAQGTPMLLGGDEMGRSQSGNNNAYCQDNETSWIDWAGLDRDRHWHAFVRRLIALRAAHPVLRRGRFAHGEPASGRRDIPNIGWYGPHGQEMTEDDWVRPEGGCLGLFLAGLFDVGRQPEAHPDILLLIFNREHSPVTFTLPPHSAIDGWRSIFTTANATGAPDPRRSDRLLEQGELAMHGECVWVLAPERRNRAR